MILGALKQASPRPGSAAFPLRPREIAKDAIPGYEITREIHRGGQGVVYQAIQKKTQRKVAIKVVHGGPFTGERERLRVEREVRILAGLDHPNIVKIHDSGEVNGSFFYVMDYVSGHSLDAFITKGPKPVEEVLRLFIEICDAVSAAHLRGVIHRDLKPGNIRIDAGGKPHVLDFGLAKLSIPDESDGHKPRIMTMTGQFIGSLPWASPEQAAGTPGAIDIRTDVYSLGVILYQLLTGKFPYQVIGQMREVLDNILKVEPARPSTVRKQINDEVETIVLKCLAKEPPRRYQSAGELARDLRRYLAGEPIEAKRDSGWYVISKTLRRHRTAAVITGAFVVLLAGFGVVMSVMWVREAGLKDQIAAQLRETTAQREAKEAARAQAQAHFETVRGMAHAFMHDFSDGIEDLRGATLVRERLLKTARGALERLADAAKADEAAGAVSPSLLRDLADAHDRVGDIEAGLYMPRAGATAQGAAEYAAARAIRERLLAAAPQDPRAQADMGESLRRTAQALQRERRYADAQAEYQRAVASLDAALALAGSLPAQEQQRLEDRRIDALVGGANLRVAMVFEAAGSLDEAGRLADGAIEIYELAAQHWTARLADPAAAPGVAAKKLGILTDQRARARTALGRAHADAAWKAADGARPEEAARLVASALSHFAGARDMASAAAEEFDRLSRARTQDGALRRDLMIALYNVGDARMREGDTLLRALGKPMALGEDARARATAAHASAGTDFERSLAVAEELVRSDAGNLEALRDQALVLNKLGNVLRDLGELDRSAGVFQRSLDIREDLWRTDPMQQHRYDLAVGLYKRAEVDRLRAGAEARLPARLVLLQSARNHFARSLEAYTALKEQGVAIRDNDIAMVRRAREEAEAAVRAAEGGA